MELIIAILVGTVAFLLAGTASDWNTGVPALTWGIGYLGGILTGIFLTLSFVP